MTRRATPERDAAGVPRGAFVRADTAALARLGRRRLHAAVRQRWRELASVKGVLSALAIGLFVGFVWHALRGGGGLEPPSFARRFAHDGTLPALVLLAACVLSVLTSRGPALHFGPAEMNLLFAAPVRRHVLVLYKYLSYVTGAVLSAALIALLLPPASGGATRLFVAMVLILLFVQLSSTLASMTVLLARRHRSWPWVRAASLLGAVAGALAIAVQVAADGTSPSDALGALPERLAGSWPGRVSLAPFALFAGLALPADSSLAFASRVALAILVLGGMLAAVVRLDRHVQEEVSSASLAAHARWQAVLRSGSPWQRRPGTLRTLRAPRRPGGIAPLAWSQALRLWRTALPVVGWLGAIALVGGASLGAFATVSNASSVAAALFFAFVFVLPKMLVFDFRGAPQDIESTKTLPVPPLAVCVAEITTPVAVVVALQWLTIGAALPFVDGAHVPLLLVLGALVVPFDVLQYALENLAFLLAPRRLVPVGRMDFDFLGRTLLEFLVKATLLVLAAGIALAAGVAALSVAPGTWALAAGVGVGAAVLALQAALALAALSLAYRRFDSSRHALG